MTTVVLTLAFALVGPAPALAADVGFRDFSYSPAFAPTAPDAESKLWFNDGIWWGSLFNTKTKKFNIYQYDWASGTWSSTGTDIDDRAFSKADALWDGSRLYIASAGTDEANSAHAGRVYRYSYDAESKRYTLDTGFPTTITQTGVPAIVLDKDSTGALWVTFTRSGSVFVTHTTTSDKKWIAPYVIPVDGAANLKDQDVSAAIKYENKIGVMWSNQNDGAYYFASHSDGADDDAWVRETALRTPEFADNHINLKSLERGGNATIYAAVKTSFNAPNEPLAILLVRQPSGDWTYTVFGPVADQHTRPLILIDKQNRELYMFAAAPCCQGGTIYYKRTSLDNLRFPTGLGDPFIQSSLDERINGPTSTKQSLDSATGLLVVAADDSTRRYLHNRRTLPDDAPAAVIDAGPQGTVDSGDATFEFSSVPAGASFECSLDGATFGACTSPKTYTGLSKGFHTFQVRAKDASGTDTTPASRTWRVSARLFSDGFERGDFSAWTSVAAGGDGSAVVQDSIVRTGALAARLSETASSDSIAYMRKRLPSGATDIVVSGEFQMLTEGAEGGHVPILRLYDPGGKRIVNLYRQNQNRNRVYVAHSGTRFLTSGGRMPLNTWTHVDLHVRTAGAGASTVAVRINRNLVYTTNTASLGTGGVEEIQIGNKTAGQTFALVADDIRVQ